MGCSFCKDERKIISLKFESKSYKKDLDKSIEQQNLPGNIEVVENKIQVEQNKIVDFEPSKIQLIEKEDIISKIDNFRKIEINLSLEECNKEYLNVFVFFFGKNSNNYMNLIMNLYNSIRFIEKDQILNINKNFEIKDSYKPTKLGYNLLSIIKEKRKKITTNEENCKDKRISINESIVLNDIIDNLQNIKNSQSPETKNRVFISAKEYNIFFNFIESNHDESDINKDKNKLTLMDFYIKMKTNNNHNVNLKILSTLNSQSIKSDNIRNIGNHLSSNKKKLINDAVSKGNLLFCFDFSNKDSFDYVLTSIEESEKSNSNFKSIVLGIKKLFLDNSANYEVNEDYADLVFKTLDIEFFKLKVDNNDNPNILFNFNQEEVTKNVNDLILNVGDNIDKTIISPEIKLFLSLFVFRK